MKKKIKKIPTESQEQQRLVMKLRWLYPDIEFFAIPNGGKRNQGEAVKLKLEGVEAGAPDLFIVEPVGKFHGLFIELKRVADFKVSLEQVSKHKKYLDRGFQVKVCCGAKEALKEIVSYLNETDL